ncbi:MAG: hypothetical protein ACI8RD_004731, partial [Bacillariaceae sp.]
LLHVTVEFFFFEHEMLYVYILYHTTRLTLNNNIEIGDDENNDK